ncbi:MAG: 2-carboxy-1,4-naphthoquinone phytyltransferase [Cyanobacteriota bacterium]|nr:2-carboxy-1,4-naphthoquinone phytyltransferase [Cyanobacteriota bacterium]
MSFQPISISPTQGKLWLAAIKPPMYIVAIIPICVGTAIAFRETQALHQGIFGLFLFSSICILAWTNISNDFFDSQTGIDQNKAHSLVNLTGQPELVFWIGNLCLLIGVLGVAWISWLQQSWVVCGLVLLGCGLGYLYQGPPFRWGYQGWGELLCFLAFGPLGVEAAYYSQTSRWSWVALAAGIVVGLSTSLILFCSHFHQVEDDRAAGKRSPVVRLGTEGSARLLPWICGFIYAITLSFVMGRVFPLLTLTSLLSLPFAIQLNRLLLRHHHQPEQISHSKFIAVSLHFVVGLGLGLGFMVMSKSSL